MWYYHRDIRNTRGLTFDRGRSFAKFLIVAIVRQKIANMRVKCIVVIATLAYDFENSHLLRCAGLSKSTKMRRRMVEMCVTVILLITFVEIKTT